jgi:hypothetical protein
MTVSTPAWLGASLVAVLVVCSCARDRRDLVTPDEGAEPLDAIEPTTEVPTPPLEEPAEHITFDPADAGGVPAEGVVAQPQRDPLPSMMGDVLYGPSR